MGVDNTEEMQSSLKLFEAFGIELEYMIVDREKLDVLPITDQLLKRVAGEYVNDIEQGDIAWSNELVLHVVELKTNGPAKSLRSLPTQFVDNLRLIQSHLDEMNARLMPTAMHPWMNPYRETKLWSHDSREIYDTYDAIFNCQGHGWSNLQSMHINLPFSNDEEFAKLHSAIRTVLAILPALSASSPIVESHYTNKLDTRLEAYRLNAVKIPSITGHVVPEPVCSKEEYERVILQTMYKDIAPFDKNKILQEEWLNSRGAIARFDRNAIEIRVLDTQETPKADLAIASLIIAVLKKLCSEDWSDIKQQNTIPTEVLAALFREVIVTAEETVIDNIDFLKLFRFPDKKATARELWMYLKESVILDQDLSSEDCEKTIDYIIKEGPLARRIMKANGDRIKRSHLEETYRVLCDCLLKGELFVGIG